jgi:two-component system heavy metal sensor histidine kinase CusS
MDYRTDSGEIFRVLALEAAGGHTVQVAMDRTYEEELLAGYRRDTWVTLAIALVLCSLVGYGLARRGLRPLRQVADTASTVRSNTLDQRLDLRGLPAEVYTLAHTINDMLDRLQDSFQRLSRFSADIAHELRTPVNNLRGSLDVALAQPRSDEEYREVLSSCVEECGRLTRLIDSLLFIARAESPQKHIVRERFDVSEELVRIREFYEPAASEAGVMLALETAPGTYAELDRTLFQRAVGNLLANALAHTPRGGSIRMHAVQRDEAVEVDVTDTGTGIAAEHLPHIFDRFYRADAARTNSSASVGLGLAIVKSIATLHGGTATVKSDVGKGTNIKLVFPTA